MPEEITFEEFREAWLADVREGNPSSLELGRRFGRKLLIQWLNVGEDSADDLLCCDGSRDGGIDIAYLSRDEGEPEEGTATEQSGHTWYLLQSKYGRAFQGSDSLVREGRKVIDTLDGRRAHLSSLTNQLIERLRLFRKQASERDRIILVFGTEDQLTHEQMRALEDVRAIGRKRLGPLFDVEAVSIHTIYQRTLEEAAKRDERVRVLLKAQVVHSSEDLMVGSATLLDIYNFLKAYRAETQDLDRLYQKNVRLFLGSRPKVNNAMQQTLKDNPNLFGLYNNGITIVVEGLEHHNGEYVLIEPYIVNGCQTTRTIWDVFHQRLEAGGTGTSEELEAWREKASRGVVVVKIVEVGDAGERLLLDITRYTNSQNAVREKDFLALTSDFRGWAAQMAERYGVFLEIQRGGWDCQRAKQRQRPDIRQFTEHANAFDLIKVYGAGWLGEAGTAFGKNAAFLPNGSIYKRIMNPEETGEPFGVDDLYAAYLLQRAADSYRFGRGAERMSRRQTRFLFYMVTMDLLRDILTRQQKQTRPCDLTRAFLRLSNDRHAEARRALLDAAAEVVDEYLTEGEEDCVFQEPRFREFNNDLNAFLKWEKLGKTEQETPRLRALLAAYKRMLGRTRGDEPSDRTLITMAIID